MAAQKSKAVKAVHAVFPVVHFAIGALFAVCGVALVAFSCIQLWAGIGPGDIPLNTRLDNVLESLAVITVALAALELAQTIIEEEVQREAQMSAPTRVRRFLSRFIQSASNPPRGSRSRRTPSPRRFTSSQRFRIFDSMPLAG